ncbi:MAG: 3-deoxy-manno-octulosonate cytidylyltransferase [Nitrospinae bacterium]|nr:3-deoxy-manno-octulosonate cytidylyltransferase [Nitrospinota bacterium]
MRVIAVIPARWASVRFPGKPLVLLCGHPMIEYVYRRASRSELVDFVCVATDDERIADAVRRFGGNVRMTRGDHASGTDRVAEIASVEDADVVVNIQGDEPLLHPDDIDAGIKPLVDEGGLGMSTLAVAFDSPEEFLDPNAVKVTRGESGNALYFSRAPIPYSRDVLSGEGKAYEKILDNWKDISPKPLKHLGFYAYRRESLLRFAGLSPSPLERLERLEQLRALEDGLAIRVVEVKRDAVGVDCPEDRERLLGDDAMRSALEEEKGRWPSISS